MNTEIAIQSLTDSQKVEMQLAGEGSPRSQQSHNSSRSVPIHRWLESMSSLRYMGPSIDEYDEDDEEQTTWRESGELDKDVKKSFSEATVELMRYWVFHTFLIVLEPIICSFDPTKTPNWIAQIVIIFVSATSLLVQIDVLVRRVSKDLAELPSSQPRSPTSSNHSLDAAIAFKEHFLKQKECKGLIIEVMCLLCGMVFVWWRPGVAVLRCFRVFRILFYNDLPHHPKILVKRMMRLLIALVFFTTPKQASKSTDLVFKLLKFTSYTMENMAQEMFYLTKKTRGGFILMLMLFYSGFILGLVAWVDYGTPLDAASKNVYEHSLCHSASTCLSSIYRLALWDTKGFDFLYSVRVERKFLLAILVVYMCGTSFGILNGLTGVFRYMTARNSKRAFVKNFEDDEKDRMIRRNVMIQRQRAVAMIKASLGPMKEQLGQLLTHVEKLEEKAAAENAAGAEAHRLHLDGVWRHIGKTFSVVEDSPMISTPK